MAGGRERAAISVGDVSVCKLEVKLHGCCLPEDAFARREVALEVGLRRVRVLV
jgi:hypothetical protein